MGLIAGPFQDFYIYSILFEFAIFFFFLLFQKIAFIADERLLLFMKDFDFNVLQSGFL